METENISVGKCFEWYSEYSWESELLCVSVRGTKYDLRTESKIVF